MSDDTHKAARGTLTWADVEGYGKVTQAQAQGYADYYQQWADKVRSESAYLGYCELADFWAHIARELGRGNHEQR